VEQGASETRAEVRFRKVHELASDEAIASNQGWAAHRLESQHLKGANNDDLLWISKRNQRRGTRVEMEED